MSLSQWREGSDSEAEMPGEWTKRGASKRVSAAVSYEMASS